MTEAYFKITKRLGRELGWEAAALYAHLRDLNENFFGGKDFYQQQSRICKHLNLSKHKIIALTQKLVEKELIEIQEHPGKKHKYRILTGKESLPLLEESSKESKPLAVKNLNREDKELIREDLRVKDEKQKDPSESITHERTSEQCFEERIDAFLTGELLDNSIFEETKQKTIIEESIEKKPVSDLTPALLQFIDEFNQKYN